MTKESTNTPQQSLRTLIADDAYVAGFQTMGQYRAALLQQANDEAKDAARYRWLRDKSEPGICAFYMSVGQAFKDVKFARETVDACIDAARAAQLIGNQGEDA
jgi:hypothetical protein